MNSKLHTLSIGHSQSYPWKQQTFSSAIGKTLVEEVFLSKQGFSGDTVVDTKHHGGVDRAVCAYPLEHYDVWEKEFQATLTRPAFGENILIKDMVEKDVYIGDIFQLGDAVIQVTQGRVPCSTISKFNGLDGLFQRIYDTCYTGYFFRVLQEGMVQASSTITFLEREQQQISVYDANYVMFHDRKNASALQQLLTIDSLAEEWKIKFRGMQQAVLKANS